MVVFTCQKCNECLKKNAVAKHAMISKKCLPFWLTCIDCLKDFKHEEYLQHTSCITEDERYGKKGTQVKPQGMKQNMWMDCVNKFISERQKDKDFSLLLNVMKDRENIPKNRKKFHNWFLSTNKRVYHENKVDELFTLLETEFKSSKESSNKENNQNGNSKGSKKNLESDNQENGEKKEKSSKDVESFNNSDVKMEENSKNDEDQPKLSKKELKKKKKMEKYQAELDEIKNCPKTEMDVEEEESKPEKKSKRKHVDEAENVPVKNKKRKADQEIDEQEEKKPKLDTVNENDPGKFRWSEVIIDVLKSRSDHELSLKRLSKKVIGEYCQRFGETQDFERLMKKFNKKLKSAQGVVLFKDKAKLEIEESEAV